MLRHKIKSALEPVIASQLPRCTGFHSAPVVALQLPHSGNILCFYVKHTLCWLSEAVLYQAQMHGPATLHRALVLPKSLVPPVLQLLADHKSALNITKETLKLLLKEEVKVSVEALMLSLTMLRVTS